MIKAQELRIGNLFHDHYTGEIIKVIGLTEKLITYSDLSVIGKWEPKPIPLSEEILLKCGFEFKDLGDESPFEVYQKGGIEMWDFNGEYWICDILDKKAINTEFKYLHQVQNLYFALTAEELKISEL